jgi:hypothetical protein
MRDEPSGISRVAGWSAYGAAVVSALGILCLIVLYIGLFTGNAFLLGFGVYNDIAIIVQYLLALPIVAALHRMLRADAPRASAAAALLAVLGIIGVTVFQWLFLTGAISLGQSFLTTGPSVLLMIGSWIVITGVLGRRTGTLHNGMAVIILAAQYFAYPVWAFRVGRQLLSTHRPTPASLGTI